MHGKRMKWAALCWIVCSPVQVASTQASYLRKPSAPVCSHKDQQVVWIGHARLPLGPHGVCIGRLAWWMRGAAGIGPLCDSLSESRYRLDEQNGLFQHYRDCKVI